MGFNWKKYLELSKALEQLVGTQGYDDEALLRSIVSRSYYAAFCNARNFLLNKQTGFIANFNGSDHAKVREHFRKDRHRREIALRLTRLREYRNDCDYVDQVENIERVVEQALKDAKYVLENTPI